PGHPSALADCAWRAAPAGLALRDPGGGAADVLHPERGPGELVRLPGGARREVWPEAERCRGIPECGGPGRFRFRQLLELRIRNRAEVNGHLDISWHYRPDPRARGQRGVLPG